MAHRIYPILGGLALGLAVFVPQPAAAAMSGNPVEYSGLNARGLVSRLRIAAPFAARSYGNPETNGHKKNQSASAV